MNDGKQTTMPSRADKTLIVICTLGALLRIFQYHAGTSLWGDELSIVRNVTSSNLLSLLTKPLSDDQIAPCGFLLLLKLIVGFAGASEYSLRFIPLLASLTSLPLFASLARKVLPRRGLLVAVFLFSTSPPLIRYAAQVKPYSSDLVASLVCLLVACSWLEEISCHKSLLAAVVGAVAIWFSYPSVFTLLTIALLALGCRTTRSSVSSVKHVAAVITTWLLSGTILAIVEHHRFSPGTQAYMQMFWADWMLPRDLSMSHIGIWLLRILPDWFRDFLHLPTWPAMCVLLVIGAYYLVRYRTLYAVLLLGPVFLTFAASVVRYYPFRGRVILFLAPNVLILLVAGLLALTRAVARAAMPPSGQQAMLLAAALIMGARPLWNNPPPYRDSETKPVLYYLGQKRHDGDAIYVHNMAWHAYEFYGPRFSLAMDQARISSLKGNKNKGGPNPLAILHDLDEFRGRRRLWIVFGGGYDEELTASVWYLDTIGRRLDCKSAYNAAVYLYDLSGPELLRAAKADDLFTATPHAKGCETDVGL